MKIMQRTICPKSFWITPFIFAVHGKLVGVGIGWSSHNHGQVEYEISSS